MRSLIVFALVGLGCQADNASEAPPAEDKCPKVDVDNMAGQWIHVKGSQGDHTYRFELTSDGAATPAYTMWYVGGGFTKRVLQGERRASDIEFTEVPDARKKAAFDKGDESLVRLYVEARKEKCALRVSEVAVQLRDGKEVERPKPGFEEYLVMPEGAQFTFHPCEEPLFIGDAASNKALADKQMSELGWPDPGHSLGEAIPIGTWSDAARDGDTSCSFDMDLYFDDQPVKDRQKLPAGLVKDEHRHWYVPDWYAPYSGNHHFELYRYRTCAGGRELLGVACLEAALN